MKSSFSSVAAWIFIVSLMVSAQVIGDGWAFSTKIVMNTTSGGANVAGDVQNFPVAVALNSTNFDFSQAASDGADIRFTDASGNLLPCQIELWDKAAQKAALWVKTDVKGNNNTQFIIMHWGKAGAQSASDGKVVFPKAEGWVGVWHLSDKGSTAIDAYKDATENAQHGKGVNITGDAAVEGRIGSAVNLAVSKKQYVRIEGSNTNPLFQINKTGTYSIWCNPRSHTITWQAMFTKGERGWRIHYWGLANWGGNNGKHITCVCISPDDRCSTPGGQGTDVSMGKWFHLVMSQASTSVALYVNGRLETKMASSSYASGDEPLCIGNNADRARSFDGLLDEARVSNVTRSESWIKLDYENQKPGSTFLGFAPTAVSPRVAARFTSSVKSVHLFDCLGRLIVSDRSFHDAKRDRMVRSGLVIERLIGTDGASVVRKRAVLP
jgi:hypothetical protein